MVRRKGTKAGRRTGGGKVKTRSLETEGCGTRQSGVKPPHSIGARLAQAVGAGTEEIEEAEVAENLELLADFVADVSVLGMESS